MAALSRFPRRRPRGAFVLIGGALLAASCATFDPIAPAERIYTGRFAATVSRGTARESVSGRFTLAVRPTSTTVDLASPLGNAMARLQASPDGATLIAPQSDGSLATWHGASPEALAESVLGWRVPVSGLAEWIAGRAVPGRPARVAPAAGAPQQIEQDGWTISIDERFPDSAAPRRLSLDRPEGAPASPAVRLRLVVDAPESKQTGLPQ